MKLFYQVINNYDLLKSALDDNRMRSLISSMCKKDFMLYYRIMSLLITKNNIKIKKHTVELASALQELTDGGDFHLSINMPPSFGKTQEVLYWMAWCLTRNPEVHFLYINCVHKSVKQRGRELRGILSSQFSRQLFNIFVDPLSGSQEAFKLSGTSHRSGFTGISMYGNTTGIDAGNPAVEGFGGGLIIDDPMDARGISSESTKEFVVETYKNALITRLRSSSCKAVVVAQRLCIDDLFATIEEEKENKIRKWRHVKFKALDDNDKSNWEDRMSTNELLIMRASVPTKFWAQYQQAPITPSGEIIKPEWFKEYTGDLFNRNTSIHHEAFITADTAVGTKKSNDYSVFCLWYLLDGGLFLVDMIRGHWDIVQQLEQITAFWKKHYYDAEGKPKHHNYKGNMTLSMVYIEDSMNGKDLITLIRKAGGSQGSFIPIGILRADKDKVTRAQEVIPYIYAGYVYIPASTEISRLLISECRSFTTDDSHKHDDIVDCLVYAIRHSLLKKGSSYPLLLRNDI